MIYLNQNLGLISWSVFFTAHMSNIGQRTGIIGQSHGWFSKLHISLARKYREQGRTLGHGCFNIWPLAWSIEPPPPLVQMVHAKYSQEEAFLDPDCKNLPTPPGLAKHTGRPLPPSCTWLWKVSVSQASRKFAPALCKETITFISIGIFLDVIITGGELLFTNIHWYSDGQANCHLWFLYCTKGGFLLCNKVNITYWINVTWTSLDQEL